MCLFLLVNGRDSLISSYAHILTKAKYSYKKTIWADHIQNKQTNKQTKKTFSCWNEVGAICLQVSKCFFTDRHYIGSSKSTLSAGTTSWECFNIFGWCLAFFSSRLILLLCFPHTKYGFLLPVTISCGKIKGQLSYPGHTLLSDSSKAVGRYKHIAQWLSQVPFYTWLVSFLDTVACTWWFEIYGYVYIDTFFHSSLQWISHHLKIVYHQLCKL